MAASTWYDPWKAVAEYLLACTLFVLAAPVILVCAALVKLTSRGPAFYSQTRVGRYGARYTIYKLRSMRHDCEKESGVCWSMAGDRRITPVGHCLRRLHLDELPQLWNVLCGEMSLVGPRPERPEFTDDLEMRLPLYCKRWLARPGVTGLAQVQQDADSSWESVRRKLAYDLYYVRSRSPWMDVRLLVGTGLKILGVSYERIGQLLALPRVEVIEQVYEDLLTETGADSAADLGMARDQPRVVNGMAPCVAGAEA